jgi:hypothetical protein
MRTRFDTNARLSSGIWIFVAAGAFYLLFIARMAFTFDERIFFSLFDDAMISMRYARNLASGDGLVWNPGDPAVEGYTNFLWTLWMAVPHLLGVPESLTSLWVMLSGVVILLATGAAVWRIGILLAPESKLVAAAATTMTLFYYPLIFWTLRGMEVGILALLTALSVLLALKLQSRFNQRDLVSLALLLSAQVLVRTDALISVLPVIAFVAFTASRADRLRAVATLAGAVAAVLLIHTGLRIAYYGDALPNTYYLKVEGISLGTRLERGLAAVFDGARVHFYAPIVALAAYVAIVRFRLSLSVCLLIAPFVLNVAYTIFVGGDAWENFRYANRYIAPTMPLLLAAVALAAYRVLHSPAGEQRTWMWMSGALLMIVIVANVAFRSGIPELQIGPTGAVRLASRVAPILLLAGFLFLLPLLPRLSFSLAGQRSLILAGFTALVLLTMDGEAMSRWLAHNAYAVEDDAAWAKYGLIIKETSAPESRIGVIAAGSLSYFSGRYSVDFLGKSDPFIAHSAPQDTTFRPGHNKWDYDHSIGDLQPDIVAQWWIGVTEAEKAKARTWGYEALVGDCMVRRDSPLVDAGALRERIRRLQDAAKLSGIVCLGYNFF